jgi:hypothetical protein
MAILWRLNGGDITRSNYKPIKPIKKGGIERKDPHMWFTITSIPYIYWFCNSEYNITFDELWKGCVILLTPGWFYWLPFIRK